MPEQKKASTLLVLCLIAGTLDAIAAILMSWKYPTSSVFQYIASGWFGPAAFKGGTVMVIWGLVFHYLIASFYSILFFLLYPGFKRVVKSRFAIAIIIGLLIWSLMNFLVLPLTNIPKGNGHISVISILISASVLCVTVGAPMVIMADRYYRNG
ncbi:MAG TPA: hypothetical protein VG367_14975 [Mucilaginibacter sp.]|jgi:hypothetical protein|nr:hypothetical protein [Mucilaginibacter sp.]